MSELLLTDDSKRKIEEHREKIADLKGRLKAAEDELKKLQERRDANPPPEAFDQSWAQSDRMYARACVSKEREASELRMQIVNMEKILEGYLRRLAEEAQQQLKADRTWWEKRKAEWEHQSKASAERKARLATNEILGDLRAYVVDDASYDRVQGALEKLEDPEILEAIGTANPGFGLEFHVRTARQRLAEYELGKA